VTSVSAVVRHLGFLKSKLIDTLCIIVPNFVEIGRVSFYRRCLCCEVNIEWPECRVLRKYWRGLIGAGVWCSSLVGLKTSGADVLAAGQTVSACVYETWRLCQMHCVV